MQGSYLGPLFNDFEIEKRLKKSKAILKIKQDKLIKNVAKEISNGKSVGWFQGRMEFGLGL